MPAVGQFSTAGAQGDCGKIRAGHMAKKKKIERNNERQKERKNGTGRVPPSLETFIAGILGGKEENEILFISLRKAPDSERGVVAEGAESNTADSCLLLITPKRILSSQSREEMSPHLTKRTSRGGRRPWRLPGHMTQQEVHTEDGTVAKHSTIKRKIQKEKNIIIMIEIAIKVACAVISPAELKRTG